MRLPSAPTSLDPRRALREASVSLSIGVFLGAAVTSGVAFGIAAAWLANKKVLSRLQEHAGALVGTAREAVLKTREGQALASALLAAPAALLDVGNGRKGMTPATAASPVTCREDTLARLARCRLVPVVTLDDVADAEPVARALLAGGLDVMELVLRTPQAFEALRLIAERVPGMLIGAGTVLSCEQAERALACGAAFLVAPGTNPDVVRWAQQRNVVMIPGVATASEVETALAMGIVHLKFFPAEANGGPKTLKDLSVPYSDVRWMPTGGVTVQNMAGYLAIKSIFAIGGSWLVPPSALKEKNYALVEKLTRQALETMAAAAVETPG
jgi:2-dehydro-3-deoxyphosphogluconate aldolase/(4S)-4-hydroxy-2-oxoglutarate aldolase